MESTLLHGFLASSLKFRIPDGFLPLNLLYWQHIRADVDIEASFQEPYFLSEWSLQRWALSLTSLISEMSNGTPRELSLGRCHRTLYSL